MSIRARLQTFCRIIAYLVTLYTYTVHNSNGYINAFMFQFYFLYKSMCTLMCYLILWHNILLTVSNLSLKCFIMHAQRAFPSSNSEINMHGCHKKDFIITIFSLSSAPSQDSAICNKNFIISG